MKTKLKKGLFLLLIIAFEIFLFNNNLKYFILGWICPGMTACIGANLIWIKIGLIFLIGILTTIIYLKLKKKKNEPLFIVYLIKGFHVKGSDLIGVFNVLFVLCSAAWISNEVYQQTLHGYLNALIYTGLLILYPIMIVYNFLPEPQPKENYHPKILIYAVSNIEERFLRPCLTEMQKKFPDKWKEQVFLENDVLKRIPSGAPWGPWGNFDPIRKSIIAHQALFDEIILIVSKEASIKIDELSNDLKPLKLLEDYLQKYYPENKTKIKIKSEDISGNDMKKNITEIENILNTLASEKVENTDILFNITGGTAAISGAMILNAIPYERRAEYARQDNGLIEEIPLDILDVKMLWHELLEKIG